MKAGGSHVRQCEFTTMITAIHAANLGNADVAFIGKNNRMIGNEFKQRGGGSPGARPVK